MAEDQEDSDEFREIAHSGGTITLRRDEHGRVSFQHQHSSPWALSMFQVCVSIDGKLLDVVPLAGIGPMPPYPQPSILSWVISDRDGMFGRHCRQCNSYFRTDCAARSIVCPYCARRQHNLNYTTENQMRFIMSFCNAFLSAAQQEGEIVINLDELANELPENRPIWHYAEEKQQNTYTCSDCQIRYDILGDYASCPECGHRNWRLVFDRRMTSLNDDFQRATETLTDRSTREREWKRMIVGIVGEFEALGNDMRALFSRMPATPCRRSEMRQLSFQRVDGAARALREWFGIDLLGGLPQDDIEFLVRIFNRRHLLSHRAGRVDQEYLDNTGDTSVRLNQEVRVRSKEVRRLLDLTGEIGRRLIDEIRSMFTVADQGSEPRRDSP